MCFLDEFCKAYNLVDHKLLLQTLKHYKINTLSPAWFESYLSNRTQQVNINRNQLKTRNAICGLPQGSILGLLLFLIFINDLLLFIGDSIQSVDLYADDTTLYGIGLDKDMLKNNLQHSLNSLKSWCLANEMTINIDKTKLMLISRRQKRKCLKDNKSALVYDNFDLQLTSCENPYR